MKNQQKIDFSTTFSKQLQKTNSSFAHDEIKLCKSGKFYSATFNVWEKRNPEMKIDTTITKPTLQELEKTIISYLK